MPYTYAGEFADAVLNTSGRPLKSTSITVKKADGTVASLYTDRTKAHAAPNPLPTDSYGNLVFFADPDAYRLFAAGGPLGGTVVVVHPDPAEPAGGGANFWPVLSEANMLALPAKKGDIAIRTDLHRNFGLQGDDPSALGDWEELEASLSTGLLHESILVGKGDLITASGAATPQRLAVGTDGLPLVADSTDALGVKYEQLHTGALADGAVTAAKVAADVATQAELDAEATARVAADALLIPIAQKGSANGVASLDSGSKVPAAQLPSITISDFLGTVANQAAMLALSGQRGDWAIRSDTSTTWMLIGDDATQLANWKQLATPADAVSSVNGRTGAVTGLAEATDVTAEAAARAAATALLLAKASNLSDVANAATARTNLGLGTAATAASTDFEATGAVAAEAALRATGDTTRVPNNQTADYTLVLGDAGKVIEINAATGKNVTVPPNSAVAYPVNTIVWVQQLGAGAATAVAGAGVTLVGASLVTSGVGSGLLLRKTATNTWVVQATSSATSAPGLNLSPTAVKTANYTAAASDFVLCNTSGGAFTVTLPTAPADKTTIAIKLVTAGNTLNLATGGSDVFNKAGGATTGTLSLLNQAIVLQYQAAAAIWIVVSDDLTLTALDARFAPITVTSGAMTVIAETVLAAPAASIDFTSIPATYRHLRVELTGRLATGAASISAILARLNNDSGTNYIWENIQANGTAVSATAGNNDTSFPVADIPDAAASASVSGSLTLTIYDYQGTTFFKKTASQGGAFYSASAGVHSVRYGLWKSAAAVNRLTLFAATSFDIGTVATLYGLAHA